MEVELGCGASMPGARAVSRGAAAGIGAGEGAEARFT